METRQRHPRRAVPRRPRRVPLGARLPRSARAEDTAASAPSRPLGRGSPGRAHARPPLSERPPRGRGGHVRARGRGGGASRGAGPPAGARPPPGAPAAGECGSRSRAASRVPARRRRPGAHYVMPRHAPAQPTGGRAPPNVNTARTWLARPGHVRGGRAAALRRCGRPGGRPGGCRALGSGRAPRAAAREGPRRRARPPARRPSAPAAAAPPAL